MKNTFWDKKMLRRGFLLIIGPILFLLIMFASNAVLGAIRGIVAFILMYAGWFTIYTAARKGDKPRFHWALRILLALVSYPLGLLLFYILIGIGGLLFG